MSREASQEESSQKTEETEEEEEEDNEDEEYEEDSDGGTSRATSEESGTEDETDAEEAPAKVIKKKLPTREVKKTKPPKTSAGPSKPSKRKAAEMEVVEDTKKEKKHPKSDGKSDEKSGEKKTKKKTDLVFDDTNLDLNLHNADPTNVISRRVLLSNNLIMTSKMISQSTNNLTYDYAALAFQRKTNNEKLFEFLIPLSLAPRIQEGLTYIMKENPKFFANKL